MEGLSVAAISHYLVGLVGYAAKAAKAAGVALDAGKHNHFENLDMLGRATSYHGPDRAPDPSMASKPIGGFM